MNPADSAGRDEVEFCATGGNSPEPPTQAEKEVARTLKTQERAFKEVQRYKQAQGQKEKSLEAKMEELLGKQGVAAFRRFQESERTSSGTSSRVPM